MRGGGGVRGVGASRGHSACHSVNSKATTDRHADKRFGKTNMH